MSDWIRLEWSNLGDFNVNISNITERAEKKKLNP